MHYVIILLFLLNPLIIFVFINLLRNAIGFNPDFVASHGLRPILVADFVRISKARIKIIEIDTLLNRS